MTPPKVAPRVRASSPGLEDGGTAMSLAMSIGGSHMGTLPHSSSGGVLGSNPPIHATNTLPLSSVTTPQGVVPGVPALSSVTKAVQLTATVNSVPVTGPSKI